MLWWWSTHRDEEKEHREKQNILNNKEPTGVNLKIEIHKHCFPIHIKNFKNQICYSNVRVVVNRYPQIKKKKVLRNKTPFMTDNMSKSKNRYLNWPFHFFFFFFWFLNVKIIGKNLMQNQETFMTKT